jgi:hypothetical protein
VTETVRNRLHVVGGCGIVDNIDTTQTKCLICGQAQLIHLRHVEQQHKMPPRVHSYSMQTLGKTFRKGCSMQLNNDDMPTMPIMSKLVDFIMLYPIHNSYKMLKNRTTDFLADSPSQFF